MDFDLVELMGCSCEINQNGFLRAAANEQQSGFFLAAGVGDLPVDNPPNQVRSIFWLAGAPLL